MVSALGPREPGLISKRFATAAVFLGKRVHIALKPGHQAESTDELGRALGSLLSCSSPHRLSVSSSIKIRGALKSQMTWSYLRL